MGGKKKKKLFHETQKTTKLASELSQRPLVLIPGGEAGWGKKVTGSACNGLEQGLGSQSEIEAGSQWWAHQILATSPVVSDKGPALRLCRKESPQRLKVVKQVEYSFRGQRVHHVWTDTWAVSAKDIVTELHHHCSLNYFYKAFLPSFLWPIILICLIHSSYLVYLRILPCVHTHLLANIDFTEKTYR